MSDVHGFNEWNQIHSSLEPTYTRGMHLLEVRHLLLIAAVADEGNLTRAGSRLNLTQSALSHQLLDIEERLGTPLFHRLNRRMQLTDAGQRLLSSARRVLEDLTNTEEDLKLFAADRRGIIRLSTECYTTYHWLPQLMKEFERQYPNIEIRIDANATGRTREALLDGQIDLALVMWEEAERGTVTKPVFDDEMLAIVSPDHPLAGRQYLKAADFEHETLITHSALAETTTYQRVLRPAGIEPGRHIAVVLTEALIEMVKAGMGIAVVSSWTVKPYIDAGMLVGIPLTRRGFTLHWQVAHLASRSLPAYFTAFIDLLAAEGERLARESARAIRVARFERDSISPALELLGDSDPLEILASTSSALCVALGGIDDKALRRPESPGRWSLMQVMQHLADMEIVTAWRYRQTIAQPDTILAPCDQDSWLSRLWNDDVPLQTVFRQFESTRMSNLLLLQTLSPEAWDRSSLHAERGRQSVRLMARIAAGHDLLHLRQIERIRTAAAA